MKLVDVNVWFAVSWEGHQHHVIAKRWLDGENDALAFCRVTQMALLRLVTNPAVMQRDVVSRREAWDVFDRLMADRRVRFLDEPDGFDALWISLSRRDDRHHLLWTDDYLAAFAEGAGAELVTFERAFLARYPAVHVTVLS